MARTRRLSLKAALLNERLNISQAMLERDIGSERVNVLVDEFKAVAAADPSLWTEMWRQALPYQWIYDLLNHQNKTHH